MKVVTAANKVTRCVAGQLTLRVRSTPCWARQLSTGVAKPSEEDFRRAMTMYGELAGKITDLGTTVGRTHAELGGTVGKTHAELAGTIGTNHAKLSGEIGAANTKISNTQWTLTWGLLSVSDLSKLIT